MQCQANMRQAIAIYTTNTENGTLIKSLFLLFSFCIPSRFAHTLFVAYHLIRIAIQCEPYMKIFTLFGINGTAIVL